MSVITEVNPKERRSDVAVFFDSKAYLDEFSETLPLKHSLRLLSWRDLRDESKGPDEKPAAEQFDEIAELYKHVLVLTTASNLPELASFLRATNRRHHLSALLVRDQELEWIPQLLYRANVRTLRNMIVHQEPDIKVPLRVLRAWAFGAEDELIASARTINGNLIIISCAMDRIEVPMESIPALRRMSEEERSHVEVSEDGSYLYWSASDINLDLDAIRYAVDDKYRKRVDRERISKDEAYGAAIAELRKTRGIRQKDIKGLSSRQVRRIEKGKAMPTVSSLKKLARAHKLSINDYLELLAKKASGEPAG